MLMPSVYGTNLFNDFFDDFFMDFPLFNDNDMKRVEKKLYGRKAGHIMNTDIKEKDGMYQLDVDLPGFTKEEISLSLENGYLTIQAQKGLDESETDKDTGNYIRRERYAGSCSRSFFVGEQITEDEVKAEFKHGILTLHIPKKDAKENIPTKKYISIEG